MEKALTHLKGVFAGTTEGLQWGAIGGTALSALLGGLMGLLMGGGTAGSIVGIAIGVVSGTLLGDKFNRWWNTLRVGGERPTALEEPARAATPSRVVAMQRDFMVGDRMHTIEVPNLERFRVPALSSPKLLSEQRRSVETLAEGMERKGRVGMIADDDRRIMQMLADAEEWNRIAVLWAKPGGERDRLLASLREVTSKLHLPFDENAVPKPPLFNVRLPELGEVNDDLRQYAMAMFRASGEGETEAEWKSKYAHPVDQLWFVRRMLNREMEELKPDWNAVGSKGVVRHLAELWTWAGMDADTRVTTAGDAGATIRHILNRKVRPGFKEYAEAMYYAKEGERLAKNEGNGTAEREFAKIKKFLEAGQRREAVEQRYDHLYRTVRRVAETAATALPAFVAQVETLKSEVESLNARRAASATGESAEVKFQPIDSSVLGVFQSPPTPTKEREAEQGPSADNTPLLRPN